MSAQHRTVYMCEVCLTASDTQLMHHGRWMIECDAGQPGDDRTQPLFDAAGRLLTHAPKWWIFRHRRTSDTPSH